MGLMVSKFLTFSQQYAIAAIQDKKIVIHA